MKLRLVVDIDDGCTRQEETAIAAAALYRYQSAIQVLGSIPGSCPLLTADSVRVVGRAWVEQDDAAKVDAK